MSLKHYFVTHEKNVAFKTVAMERSALPKTIKTAFNKRIMTLSYKNTNAECLLVEVFLNEILKTLQYEVISFLKINIAIKFNIELYTLYTRPNMKLFDNKWIQPKKFKTETQESFYIEDFREVFLMQIKNLKRRTEEYQVKEGGWALWQLLKADINLNKYQPFKGACHLPLPKSIGLKKACINVRNKDEFCFKWAVVSALAGVEKQNSRTSAYKIKIESKRIKLRDIELNFKDLSFPLQIKDIAIFEKNNPSISIHVFGYDEENDCVCGPYYKSKSVKHNHINLFYYEGKIEGRTVGHYVWIKDMSRLISNQITNANGKMGICDVCLYASRNMSYDKHIGNCGPKIEALCHEMCALEFKNSIKIVDVPFVIYAKFKRFPQSTDNGNPLSYIFMYFLKCSYDDDLNKWQVFKGPNAPRQFAESLIEDAEFYYKNYSTLVKPKIPLTFEQILEYENNDDCFLCLEKIPTNMKVKLHCRLTGNYKGPAHHVCAFNYRIPKKFPVIFESLTIEDSELLIKQLSDIDEEPISVRTLSNELYISFEKEIKIDADLLRLRFLNFSMFLSCGLDSLIEDIPLTDFKNLKSFYADDNKFNMIFSKIVFPSKYLHCEEQLEENCLPSIENFYDYKTNEECSEENYTNAQKLWQVFECNTLGDYLKVCLEINTLLLTDAFENFRLVCRNAYYLDPCHYFSAADFSWDAMLKLTGIKLSLPSDKEMHVFLEKGMRGGISKCFQRYSCANNKYLSEYDDKQPSKYLMSFHANDLYSRVMTEFLPQGKFEWETDLNFSCNSIPTDSEIGYILEVDLEYPANIFQTHKILPFCSRNIDCLETGTKKMVLELDNQNNYILYYRNLQQCLKYGLQLKKIHRILKFKQSDWLKKYIIFNKNPKNPKNSFEVNVLNLMNNAVYEKIMQNSEKKIKIIDKWESEGRNLGARALIAKPAYSSVRIIDENLTGVEVNTNVYKHVPVYIEFILSELVKLKMYNFHYGYIMSKYKTNVQLNYIDCDFLVYTITTDDLYEDIKNDIYTMINPTGCNNSRLLLKTLGMMKDANDGVVLKEFIGFRSKLYTLKTENVQQNSISLSDYTNFFLKDQICCDSTSSFKSKLYQRYFKLLQKGLPLSYLYERTNVLSEEIVNKLGCLYYQKPFFENNPEEVVIMDVD